MVHFGILLMMDATRALAPPLPPAPAGTPFTVNLLSIVHGEYYLFTVSLRGH